MKPKVRMIPKKKIQVKMIPKNKGILDPKKPLPGYRPERKRYA